MGLTNKLVDDRLLSPDGAPQMYQAADDASDRFFNFGEWELP